MEAMDDASIMRKEEHSRCDTTPYKYFNPDKSSPVNYVALIFIFPVAILACYNVCPAIHV